MVPPAPVPAPASAPNPITPPVDRKLAYDEMQARARLTSPSFRPSAVQPGEVALEIQRVLGTNLDVDILNLRHTRVDARAIEKVYRKSALRLHPDKTDFPGAAEALAKIGDAKIRLLRRVAEKGAFDA